MKAVTYEICIKSFNPDPERFPNRRVITREALHLIKGFREKGYVVRILPDDGTEINILTEKGIKDFLKTNILIQLFGLPFAVFAGVLATHVTSGTPATDQTHIIIEAEENGHHVKFDYTGKPLTEEATQVIIKALDEKCNGYKAVRNTPSPFKNKPVPILYQHTSKIVGWGTIHVNEIGLIVDDVEMTDEETFHKLQKGELKGFSIAILARESTCMLCGEDYFKCNHIAGKSYDGVQCVNRIGKSDLLEVSVVEEPVNAECKVHFKEEEINLSKR
jgi:hypothetical protein